jgi:hypothetical protein
VTTGAAGYQVIFLFTTGEKRPARVRQWSLKGLFGHFFFLGYML